MKFDICVMNPPYDDGSNGTQFYVKFINECINLMNKGVFITPDNAFFSKRKKNKKFIENINKYKPQITTYKWEDISFDCAPNSIACISCWNIDKPNEVILVNDKLKFDKQENMINTSSEYLIEFGNKVKSYFKNHKSIYDVCIANPKNTQYFDPTGRAKVIDNPNKNLYYTVFPYCIAAHLTTFYVEQYSDKLWYGPARILVGFETQREAENLYKTIHRTSINGEKIRKGDLNTFFTLILKCVESGMFASVDKYKYFPYLNFNKFYTTKELFDIMDIEYDENEIDKILNE